jgi:hypothetical protein
LAPIGFAAVVLATADFWMPLQYRLDEKGAALKCGFSTTAIEWANVKRVILGEEGVKLSPLEEESRLSPFRGLFLRFDGNREEVLDRIREKVGQDVRFLE